MRFVIAALPITLITAASVVVGMPMDAFRIHELHRLSPEAVEIRADRVERTVTKRKSEGCRDVRLPSGKWDTPAYCFYETEDITIAATVTEVTRSKSGLKPGQAIRIVYGNQLNGAAACGLEPTPLLRQGRTYPAFLAKMPKGFYVPHFPGPGTFRTLSAAELEPATRMSRERIRERTAGIAAAMLLLAAVTFGVWRRVRLSRRFRPK